MATEEMYTDLPTVATAQLTDIVAAVQGYVSPSVLGTSVQETWQQVFNLFQSNATLTYAGNPNGFVAGQTYISLWDSVNKILWICTTSGTSTTAVWTKSIQLTAGTGISISQAGDNITVSASGGALAWNHITAVSAQMASNNGYITDNAGTCSLTLPVTSSLGDIIKVTGIQGTWSILTNVGQNVQIGSSSAGASVTSTDAHDSLEIVCTVANTTWQAMGAPQSAGLTIV